MLEAWMKSYRPDELFDENGRLVGELAELAPSGNRRMSANPHANGGLLRKELRMPDFQAYAVDVPAPGAVDAEATSVQGQTAPRRARTEPRAPELPYLQPGRDQLESLGRRSSR